VKDAAVFQIEVILAEPKRCQKIALAVGEGTTARDALRLAVDKGLDVKHSGIDPDAAPLGVYALKVDDEYLMREGDRLEVYRPLMQDPMELRRKRAKQDAALRKKRRWE